MAIPVINFTGDDAIIQGSTFEKLIQLLDNQVPPQPIGDITGKGFRAHLRADVADVTPALIADLHGTVVNGPAAIVRVRLSPAETEAIKTPLTGKWDGELYDALDVERVVGGTWELSREVTR